MQSFIEDSAQFQNSKSQPNTYVGKYFSDQQQKMKTMKEEVWKGIIAILYTGSPECSQSTQWACNWDTRLIGHYFPGVFTSDENLNLDGNRDPSYSHIAHSNHYYLIEPAHSGIHASSVLHRAANTPTDHPHQLHLLNSDLN